MASSVTIKDIASSLGISAATVSRALQDHPSIRESTKIKVREKAKELNYTQNPIAYNLKKGRSGVLGVIVPDLSHLYFAGIISGMEEVASLHKRNIVICQSFDDVEKEIAAIKTLLSYRVDGILISVSKQTSNTDYFDQVIASGTPIAFFDRVLIQNQEKYLTTTLNDEVAAYQATLKLIQKGIKNIVILTAPENLNIGAHRLHGVLKALQQNGITSENIKILSTHLTYEIYNKQIQDVLKKPPTPDALFVCSGVATAVCLHWINKYNIVIGKDIHVAGFLTEFYPGHSVPGLIRLHAPLKDLGRKAATQLIEYIDAKHKSITHQVISAYITEDCVNG